MENKIFGFGIIGAGTISDTHAKAIMAIGKARLIGVYNIHKSKADVLAKKYNCLSYESLEDLVTEKKIDIICICTPSGIHLEPALKCIEAGKHCVIEKPLEVTIERCDQIISAAKKAAVKIGVIFPSRFYEVNKQIKRSLDEKRFGDLVLGDAYVKWHRTAEYYESGQWRGTWKYDGGGALMNQGIHSVDLLQWIMGPIKTVQAIAANIRHKNIEVEDTVVAILKFANGALGTLECSTAAYPGSFKRIEIIGTLGTAIVEENSLIKWRFEKELDADGEIREIFSQENTSAGGVSDPAAISFLGHQKQIEDMIEAVENNSDPAIDGAEGKKSVEIVLAIYESARTGRTVELSI